MSDKQYEHENEHEHQNERDHDHDHQHEDENQRVIKIKIDRADYAVPASQNPVQGAYLRSLANVGDDYDLWLKAVGHEDDRLISSEDTISLKSGMQFYTAKSVITPGCVLC